MPTDAFPSTLVTWIARKEEEGESGRDAINQHVMAVYGEPLCIYLRGHSLRWLGEPEELIDGFFADRLDRGDFIAKWRRSGMPLRRWLMNALNFYLMEVRRAHQQTPHAGAGEAQDEQWTMSDSPEQVIDRAFARSIVKAALSRAEQRCTAKGLDNHWHVFVRHYYEDEPYEECAAEYGVGAERARIMARTAARVFRAALRDLLAGDGAAPERIDQEIHDLLEVIQG